MCISIVARVLECDADRALVEVDGFRRTVLLAADVGATRGKFLLIHAGLAVSELEDDEAKEMLDLTRRAKDG